MLNLLKLKDPHLTHKAESWLHDSEPVMEWILKPFFKVYHFISLINILDTD